MTLKDDIPLDTLLQDIKQSLQDKEQAQNAIVKAQDKVRKAHAQYLILMDIFHAKEYTMIH